MPVEKHRDRLIGAWLHHTLWLVAGGLWLFGCTVGPDYVEPEFDMPAEWSGAVEGGLADGQADVGRWWAVFNDPVLDSLIERAVAANHDLRIAEARLRQSRARWEGASSDFWPTGTASASFSRQRISGNTSIAGLVRIVTADPTTPTLAGLDPPAPAPEEFRDVTVWARGFTIIGERNNLLSNW